MVRLSQMGEFQRWRQGMTLPCPVTDHWEEVQVDQDLKLRVGDTVELEGEPVEDVVDQIIQRNGDFLRIASILKHKTQPVTHLRGYRMRRTYKIHGLHSNRLNELCMLVPWRGSDGSALDIQALEDVSITNVLKNGSGCCVTRKAIITNARDFLHSFRHEAQDINFPLSNAMSDVERAYTADNKVLVCRWVHEFNRDSSKFRDESIRRIVEHECDLAQTNQIHRIYSVNGRLLAWNFLKRDPRASQQITFGDMFCGCGGMAQGAIIAGIIVVIGVDKDPEAARTWKLNCPGATIVEDDIFTFLQRTTIPRVDILHFSPPCQAFSAANTGSGTRDPSSIQGQRDESNEAAMLCIKQVLERVRPRIVTLEQTSGLVRQSKHSRFFKGLIGQFTACGYSVRAKVLDMASYGVPQHRKRLILIASCPGCALPPWPVAKYGDAPGLTPTRTVHDLICDVRDPHHGEPCKGPLRNIIMTGGSRDSPLGQTLSVAQLQDLMTFPRGFGFPVGQLENAKKRQLGNAVPPKFAKALMGTIIRAMREEDRRWDANSSDDQDVVDLTNDDTIITPRETYYVASDSTEDSRSSTTEGVDEMDLDVTELTRDEWDRAQQVAMTRRDR